MAAAAAVARFAGVSRKESLTPCHRLRGRPGSCSSWRARAAEEGRASPSENGVASGRPLVAILWDLDNVSPGVDPERARITARRLRDAASRLGGGALGGASAASGEDVAGPADIVAFLGFANDATLARVSARALREEGVDVRRAESTPDAADMDLGAHVLGFARAWAASERGGADVSEPPPFVTPRALAAARAAARGSRVGSRRGGYYSPLERRRRGIPRRGGPRARRLGNRARRFRAFRRDDLRAVRRPVKRGPSEGGAFRRHVGQRRRARRFLRAAKMRRSRGGVRRLPPEGAAGGRRRAGEQAETRGVAAFFEYATETKKRGGRDAAVLVPPAGRRRRAAGGPAETRRRVGRRAGLGLDPRVRGGRKRERRRGGRRGVAERGQTEGGRTLAFALAGDSARRPLLTSARACSTKVRINQYPPRLSPRAARRAVCVRTPPSWALFARRAPATAGGSLPCPSSARP